MVDGEHIREDVAILRTDIEWIKEMLKRLDSKLDQRDEEWKQMFNDMKDETNGRFNDMEKKIQQLEEEVFNVKRQLAKIWGLLGGVGAIATILEILHYLGLLP